MTDESPIQPSAPKYDASQEHMQRPKVRRLRGFPLQGQGQDGKQVTLLGLADAQQISGQVVATNPAFQVVIPLMDGSRDLDQITEEVGRGLTRQVLESFVAQLDGAGLLHGPTFEALAAEVRSKFDEAEMLPPGSTAAFADALVQQAYQGKATEEQREAEGAGKLSAMLDRWMEEAAKQLKTSPLESLPKAIVAPHIDYPRGWINYAAVWGRLRGLDRPDRVVVLGTNHFGSATGVCGCDKGWETPIGACPAAEDLIGALREGLGDEGAERLFRHRYDHENEHSIELQIPWILKVFGEVPVFGALVHDPAVNNGESYDGEGLDLDAFVAALRGALERVGGRTLIVSSADLSHVGPAFGDQQSPGGDDEPAKQFRERVTTHDREMLEMVKSGRGEDLVGSMAWQQNPTRWCSLGSLVATLRATEPEAVEIISYAAAVDPTGQAMVSSAALVMR